MYSYVQNSPIKNTDPYGTDTNTKNWTPNNDWAQKEAKRLVGSVQEGPSLELVDGQFRTIQRAKETIITAAEARGQTSQPSPQQPPPEPDHRFGFYPMTEAKEQLGKQASEAFKGGRNLEGAVGLGLEFFMSGFAQAENLMPYNIPDHFLSAGQYAKRWIWYDMRGQSGKGLLELGKGLSEAASIVESLESIAQGLKKAAPSELKSAASTEVAEEAAVASTEVAEEAAVASTEVAEEAAVRFHKHVKGAEEFFASDPSKILNYGGSYRLSAGLPVPISPAQLQSCPKAKFR